MQVQERHMQTIKKWKTTTKKRPVEIVSNHYFLS